MVRNYWGRVVRRAFVEGATTLGINSRERIVIYLGVAAIAVAGLLFWGSADAAHDELVVRFSIVAGIVLILPFVFLWKLVSVPAKIDGERDHVNKVLGEKLITHTVRIDKIRALSILRESGLELATVRIIKPEQYDDWKTDVEKWKSLSLTYIAHYFSYQDAVAFKFTEFTYQKNFVYKLNDEHGRNIIELMGLTMDLNGSKRKTGTSEFKY
ncbi:MAG: hypothetical protein WD036_01505 [Bauldia sp.]